MRIEEWKSLIESRVMNAQVTKVEGIAEFEHYPMDGSPKGKIKMEFSMESVSEK